MEKKVEKLKGHEDKVKEIWKTPARNCNTWTRTMVPPYCICQPLYG